MVMPNHLVTIQLRSGHKQAAVAHGTPLFEAVRRAGIPLGSSCRGKGICGWCRLQVLQGAEALSRLGKKEQEVLGRFDAGPDERVACLARVQGPVTVTTPYW